MTTKLPVLLFDSECTFCVRFTQALKLVDGKGVINFTPIQNMEIYEEYSELSFEDCSETIHLIKEDGSIVKGADVIKYLTETIPAVKKFAWLLEPQSAQNAINAFYNKVNDARKVKKKHKGCTTCGNRRSPHK
jgi:predicted DCC family thiol-disulfide oxidoreductase YuxK